MRSINVGVVLAAIALAACSSNPIMPNDGGEDASVDAAPPDLTGADFSIPDDFRVIVLPSQFQKDLAQAICNHLQMCGDLAAANMAACIEAQTANLAIDLDDEAKKGRLQLNEDQCIAAVMGARCDGEDIGNVFVHKCADLLFVPKEPSNGTAACIASNECINGFCQQTGTVDGGVAAPEGCAGICQPFKNVGDGCDASDLTRNECGPMNFCDSSTSKCVARPGVGGACGAVPCQDGLFCDPFAAGGAMCAMPNPTGTTAGAPCNTFQNASTDTPACTTGFYCKFAGGAFTGCQPKIASGQPCDHTQFFAGLDNACVDGTVCYKAGVQTQETCQPPAALGAACDTSDHCQSTLYCDPVSHLCAALIADGATCLASNPNGYCVAGSKTSGGPNHCFGTPPVCNPEKTFNDACNPTTDDAICGGPPGTCDPTSLRCAPKCI